MKGILNINKESGMTSGDVVIAARKILGVKAVGHMGTLDPQGSGVLLLGVGKAARLFSYFLKKDKVYDAEFCFGYQTDTLDGDGKITETTKIIPSENQILSELNQFLGKIEQMPPKYSAKNIDGKRAYDLAREGIDFTLKPSEVEIFDIKLLYKTCENTFKFRIHCGAGTYIRSICRDLAFSLGSLATMTSINRIRCGEFKTEDAVALGELRSLKEKALITVESALENIERVDLPDESYDNLINGIKIPFSSDSENFTVYCKNELFGLGKAINGILKITTYLRD